MKIMVLADKESPWLWDYFDKSKLEGIDLILSCGDLHPQYLSFLATFSRGLYCMYTEIMMTAIMRLRRKDVPASTERSTNLKVYAYWVLEARCATNQVPTNIPRRK